MKRAASFILLAASLTASAQVTTHCTTNGNQTDCTSYDQQQQENAYEAGRGIGMLIMV